MHFSEKLHESDFSSKNDIDSWYWDHLYKTDGMEKFMNQIHLFLSFICITFMLSACSSVCENRIITAVSSPDKKVKAVLFERSAGATTGNIFNSQ